jgi:hypothetical protein
MQHNFRASSLSVAPSSNNSFPSPEALETEPRPGTVPLRVHQQMAEELESARQQVSRLSLENQRLRTLHQQLSGEIAALEQEIQGHVGQILKRLQQLNLRLADSSQQAAASEREATTASWRRDNPTSSPYDFLNRLKQRQARSEASPFSSNGYSPTLSLTGPPSESLHQAHFSAVPTCPPHETPAAPPSPQAKYQFPSLEELMQNRGNPALYPSEAYQRARDHHHGSQGSPLLWIAAAIVLVAGSFGLGFVAVQPFLHSSSPSPQAPSSGP